MAIKAVITALSAVALRSDSEKLAVMVINTGKILTGFMMVTKAVVQNRKKLMASESDMGFGFIYKDAFFFGQNG